MCQRHVENDRKYVKKTLLRKGKEDGRNLVVYDLPLINMKPLYTSTARLNEEHVCVGATMSSMIFSQKSQTDKYGLFCCVLVRNILIKLKLSKILK